MTDRSYSAQLDGTPTPARTKLSPETRRYGNQLSILDAILTCDYVVFVIKRDRMHNHLRGVDALIQYGIIDANKEIDSVSRLHSAYSALASPDRRSIRTILLSYQWWAIAPILV